MRNAARPVGSSCTNATSAGVRWDSGRRLVDLDAARKKRTDAHRLLLDSVDPLASSARRRAKAASAKTFREAARAYIETARDEWKNPTHASQWYMTLNGETEGGEKTAHNYCAAIHDIPVGEIDTAATPKLAISNLAPLQKSTLAQGLGQFFTDD